MIDFAKLHADPRLEGKRVRIHACIAIPMDDSGPAPSMIVLYPCGLNLSSDEEVEKVAIAARPVSEAALAPFRNAGIPLRPEIQADFSGRLTRRQLESSDPRKHLLLEFDEMSNLARYPLPDQAKSQATSTHEIFRSMSDAALRGDAADMRATGSAWLSSGAAQDWLQQGRDHNTQQRESELAAQLAQQQSQQAQVQAAPVMHR
ncbi:MAG: hypothetical protein JF567_07710 [Xanthomonadales bacterium]|nr:hypothetical protein [Xanthomonadales bacterium]